MSEAATLAPVDTFAAEAPNVSETELPEGLSAEAPEQGDGLESQTDQELADEIEEIGEDDPRVSKLLAERDRRRDQALADQRKQLEDQGRQAAEQAAAAERLAMERRMASDAGIAETSKALGELLDSDPVELGDRLKELAANLHAGAERKGMDTLHEHAKKFMVETYGRFVMPNAFIDPYQEAMKGGKPDIASGLMLEAIRAIAREEGRQAEQHRIEQERLNGKAADTHAETVAGAAAAAKRPDPTPRGGVAPKYDPRKILDTARPSSPEYAKAYEAVHGMPAPKP